MILFDYSAVVISSILGTSRSDLSNYYEDDCDLLKHILFNRLRHYNKTFGAKYGKLVVCLDGRKNWRKDVFPLYKCKRKKDRADSKIDWQKLFAISEVIKEDLRTTFPYKVIEIQNAEADDIIGVLGKYIKEPNIIISNDKDFRQLLDLPNVCMYSPMHNKLVTNHQSAHKILVEHVIRGDSDDSIPNILSPDDIFITPGKKQKNITVPYVDTFWDRLLQNQLTDAEKANWNRNVKLIDLNAIPREIKQSILDEYTNYEIKGNRNELLNYFIKHQFKLLIPSIHEF